MNEESKSSLPVLLVDDEQQLLLSSSVVLRVAGIKNVHTIEDSRKVLSFLENHEVAVIVLDIRMPYLSGMELLPQITKKFPGLPVIIMTALNDTDTETECIKAGAFDYLSKPLERDQFVSIVKKALGMKEFSRGTTKCPISQIWNYLRK
jgi:DNA-binding NtrC family response regulator